MKKLILLLLFLSSCSLMAQVKNFGKKPEISNTPARAVEYEISTTVTKTSPKTYEVTTKLFILRQRQEIFEIFAKWENLARNSKMIDSCKSYQHELAKKELRNLGFFNE